MKKLLLIALALNFVACSTENEKTSAEIAEVTQNLFNPNPGPEDYRFVKDPNFLKDEKELAEKEKGFSGKKSEVWVRTYVPDPNFRLALINVAAAKEDAVVGDNYLNLDATRFALYIPSANITDATGIEVFTSMSQLLINGNKLKTLNLSKLTNLRWLECQNNQLTSLNLAANTILTQIWCYNNQLTTLTLPPAVNTLWGVWCYGNKLTSLELNGNNKLTSLFVHTNQLKTLNTTALTLLEKANLSTNKWVTLNFDSNTKLTALWCYGNSYLTDISIKNNNNFAITTTDFTQNFKKPKIHVDPTFLSQANQKWPNSGGSIYQL
jgi:hypothetical protein